MSTRAPQQKRKRRFNDLSGNMYGHLTVLYRTDDDVSSSGKVQLKYHCRCDCGNECDVRASRLKAAGDDISCGCRTATKRSRSMTGRGFQDLTGQVFGRWTVVCQAESLVEGSGRKATMWHCRCECGTERDVRAGTLKNGMSKSCGCLKHDTLSVARELTGRRFGRWTVVGSGGSCEQRGRAVKMWTCRCECGTERDVVEQSLVTGKSVSCGCYRIEKLREVVTYDDLTGRVFNRWTVLSREDDRFYPGGGRAQMWLCRCECGTESLVAAGMLKSGISQSCGCLWGSILEAHVRAYLDSRGYRYVPQQTFDGLVGEGGQSLSYDFLVYKDDEPWLLIECQGEQHFRPVEYFGGEAKFKVQQEHDRRKREYAAVHGLEFLEVLYTCHTYDDVVEALEEGPFHYEVVG